MVDSTSQSIGMHPNTAMNVIGYAIAAILLVLVLPLVPFFVVYLVIDRLLGSSEDTQTARG